MSKNALITGATGFVGSNLTRHLLANGWNVAAVIRPSSDLSQLKDIKGIQTHTHDNTCENLIEIVKAAKPDCVFHLASCVLVNHLPAQIESLIQSNVLFGSHLAEAMAHNNVRNLVNTSTGWLHFNNEDYNPVNLYAATKKALEDVLKFYSEAGFLDVITLKLNDTYGPNDPRGKLIPTLCKQIESGEELAMSLGGQFIDLVHVQDVVKAFSLAAEMLRAPKEKGFNQTYAVSSQRSLSLRDLVRQLEEIIGKDAPIEWGGRPYRDREVMEPWQADKLLPGWIAEIPLKEGLEQIIAAS